MKVKAGIVAVLLLTACPVLSPAARDRTAAAQAAPAEAGGAAAAEQVNPQQALVREAAGLAAQGQAAQALAKVDEALAGYQARFASEKRRINAARSSAEGLLYMVQAANDQAADGAVLVDFEYGLAWYLRGYLLIELQRPDEALPALRKAAQVAPMNAQFQSELGHLHQERKDWPAALAAYRDAATASEISPEQTKAKDRGRALRGQGFVLIEMGRLDEAETVLEQALQLDPSDRGAANELEHIRQVRQSAGRAPVDTKD